MEPPSPRQVRDDGLCFDPHAAVAHLRATDPVLGDLIERTGEFTMRPDPALGVFEYLVRSIVFQQLNGTAAATIHGRLLGLFGGEHPTPVQLVDRADDELRVAGISRGKAAALRDLARHALEGTVPAVAEAHALDDDELVERLTRIRGIGPWTVHMLLIFRLGRADVLPTGDYGVRAGFAAAHGLGEPPTPRELEAHAEPWRPYRSVASWYMWRALER